MNPTKRQMQILSLVANGLTHKEVAKTLGTSASTVKNQMHNLLERVGAKSQAHAVFIVFAKDEKKP